MIRELRIENLLLIERAELRFGAGLNAITGETGAGKTVLAHSLDLLLGGKPRSGIVRPGASEAWVEGCFDLPPELRQHEQLADLLDRVPDGDQEVVLARRVSAAGRSTAFVAGRAASAADLKALGGQLIAFYGQHEHRKLTLASVQAEILDGFAGEDHLQLLGRYGAAHRQLGGLSDQLAGLQNVEGARARDLDLLSFELEEIEALAPSAEEHSGLVVERDRLAAVDGLRQATSLALEAIAPDGDEGGARSAIAEAEAATRQGSGADPELDQLAGRIGTLDAELGDLAGELRSYLEGLAADPERLDEVEGRLGDYDRLLRKHGGSIEDVLAHGERCRDEIDRLTNAESRLEELRAELEAAREIRSELAAELTDSREQAAPRLQQEVSAALADLSMEGARLEVALRPQPDGFGPSGAERIVLMVATNPGMPLAPLGEAASGGEISRVLLALAGLGSEQDAKALVFDEIDAGIGGVVARSVGERLKLLGQRSQVICITHLPQVASMASSHFRMEKNAEGDLSRATVEAVEGDELVAEIVRMLGADTGDRAAGTHARELLAA